MDVKLVVTGDEAVAAMRSLEAWLAGRDELRGRVRPVVGAPEPGTMGSVTEALVVMVGQGGVATAVASVLISWIRRQTGTVSVCATRPDGTRVTLTADHVRGLSPEEVRSVITQLGETLDGAGAGK